MLNIEIKRPKAEDVKELHEFFKIVITDTLIKEGIGNKLDDLEKEIEAKKKYLKNDIDSKGENRYFLIALDGDTIIGSIEYGPASDLINTCTNHALRELMEVGTVLVLPEYQRKGVGNLLLSAMYSRLRNLGIEEFCLDSGYPAAQQIWKKKFGQPDYLLKDYWGMDFDHMIWKIRLKD